MTVLTGDSNQGAAVTPDLAGSLLQADIGEHHVEIRIPSLDENRADAGPAYGFWIGDDRAHPTGAGLRWLQVDVEADVPDGEARDPALRAMADAALSAATRLADGVRQQEPWQGLVGSQPEVVGAELLATGIETVIEPADWLARRPRPLVVTSDLLSFEQLSATVLEGGLDPAQQLLAQARYFGHFAADPQPGLAVLLAAMACESRAKTVLLDGAPTEQVELLRVLLESPRIFQQPAFELFDKVAKASVGRSLRDDDKELFKAIIRLFEVRNSIAHRADAPSAEAAAELVRAAMRAFEWLDASPPVITAAQQDQQG
jgi:hypothetical protein